MYTINLKFDGKKTEVLSQVKPELGWALKVNKDGILYILKIEDVLLDTTVNITYIVCDCKVLKKFHTKKSHGGGDK